MAAQPKLQKSSAERDLEQQIAELKQMPDSAGSQDEIERLRHQLESMKKGTHASPENAEAWNRVLLARHPQRPYTRDYAEALFTDFTELHGDRRFGDDLAMVCGPARFAGRPVMIVGEQKGRDTKQKVACNFGMPKPEGYRKALRMMQFAAKFRLPIITFVDTPGAYPGIGAEERGQAEAIAYNLKEIPKIPVPIVVVIHGEGGSGGALAIAIGDKVLMMRNAVYSVIAPESCSSILWRDWDHKEEAARILRLTSEDLKSFGVIDEVAPEPPGGAHTDAKAAAELLRPLLAASLQELSSLSNEELLRRRHERLRRLATFVVGE
ncbi:MAG TPA: acetyl-CoA carboxylase carboxyltransferase subunit alpha [Terriglobia bacterium]|nr:acetyl-CoA carboxylase carboxyltransferase subunit alpha [Terriglobia bacterium]